jgi:hypothetical protein
MASIKATQNDVTGDFPGEVLPHLLGFLEMPNVFSAGPKIRGSAIASKRNVVRTRDFRSTRFAAARENQCLHPALADEADRQKRSVNTSPRQTFKIAGISEPFD